MRKMDDSERDVLYHAERELRALSVQLSRASRRLRPGNASYPGLPRGKTWYWL